MLGRVYFAVPLPTQPSNTGNPPRKGRIVRELAERIEELLPQLPRGVPGGEVVYFVAAGPYVKIGHSTHDAIDRRVAELQTGNPETLEVLALFEGGLWLEQALHDYFAGARVRGEWFELTAEIRRLCGRP